MKLLLSALLFVSAGLMAQGDSVAYSRDMELKEGVYLSWQDFRKDAPIPKSKIVSNYNKSSLDFLKQETAKSTIQYLDSSGTEKTVKTSALWGFCSNNSVYINYGRDFSKVMVIGGICHFTAMVEVYLGGYDQYSGTPTTMRGYQMEQLVIDSRTGKVGAFTLVNIEALLQQDEALYTEFMALSKRKRKDAMFLYIRKFNEKHPLYFKS